MPRAMRRLQSYHAVMSGSTSAPTVMRIIVILEERAVVARYVHACRSAARRAPASIRIRFEASARRLAVIHQNGGTVSRFLLRCTMTAACAVTLSSAPALAQSDSSSSGLTVSRTMPTIMAPATSTTPVRATEPLSPSTSFDRVASARSVNEDVASVVRRRAPFSRPAVLMITGGALLLTGLLVDGDASSILIIAGAGIGGYGLYLHLQSPDARP